MASAPALEARGSLSRGRWPHARPPAKRGLRSPPRRRAARVRPAHRGQTAPDREARSGALPRRPSDPPRAARAAVAQEAPGSSKVSNDQHGAMRAADVLWSRARQKDYYLTQAPCPLATEHECTLSVRKPPEAGLIMSLCSIARLRSGMVSCCPARSKVKSSRQGRLPVLRRRGRAARSRRPGLLSLRGSRPPKPSFLPS